MTDKAKKLAMDLWKEQVQSGLFPEETPDEDRIDEWIGNRSYPLSVLESAATGDVAALAEVRSEAGLTIFL